MKTATLLLMLSTLTACSGSSTRRGDPRDLSAGTAGWAGMGGAQATHPATSGGDGGGGAVVARAGSAGAPEGGQAAAAGGSNLVGGAGSSSASAGAAGQPASGGVAGLGGGGESQTTGGRAGAGGGGDDCIPGERKCSNGLPRFCSASGAWEDEDECAFGEQCRSGMCSTAMVALSTPAGVSYLIDRTEVVRDQYDRWLALAPTPAMPPACAYLTSFAPDPACTSHPKVCAGDQCGTHPRTCIDWCSAYAYCQDMGKHLCGAVGGATTVDLNDPEQDEWYNACSSGGQNIYPYASSTYVSDACNSYEYWNSDPVVNTALPVGSLASCQATAPSYRGVLDLSGNVWEWTGECSIEGGANDECPIRGGCYGNTQASGNLRCNSPASAARSLPQPATGFRCCATSP